MRSVVWEDVGWMYNTCIRNEHEVCSSSAWLRSNKERRKGGAMIAGDKTDMHSDPMSQSLFSSSQSLSSPSTFLKGESSSSRAHV
jgi:hypothetical protein